MGRTRTETPTPPPSPAELEEQGRKFLERKLRQREEKARKAGEITKADAAKAALDALLAPDGEEDVVDDLEVQDDTDQPTDQWTTDRLCDYVDQQIATLHDLAVSTGLAKFRLGRALSILQQRETPEDFSKILDTRKLSQSTSTQAIRLYRRAKNEDAVKKLSSTAALNKFGVVRVRPDPNPYDTVSKALQSLNSALEAAQQVQLPDPERAAEIQDALLKERGRLEAAAQRIADNGENAREFLESRKK